MGRHVARVSTTELNFGSAEITSPISISEWLRSVNRVGDTLDYPDIVHKL
jgi:hypothetical protein